MSVFGSFFFVLSLFFSIFVAAKLTNNKQRDKNNLFIVFNYIAATKILKKSDNTKKKLTKTDKTTYLNLF